MSSLDQLVEQHRIELFLFLEARLIDERRFAEWEALWSTRASTGFRPTARSPTPAPRCR